MYLFKFPLGYSTNTVGSKIRVSSLYTTQTTQIFITLFFPLCYQVLVRDIFCETVVIQFSTDCFPPVEQVINISRLLVVNFKYRPQRLVFPFAFV
jgi:hypothetical protein